MKLNPSKCVFGVTTGKFLGFMVSQRLMNRMFAHQIGRNVEVYVDDMLVKSIREDEHLSDLQETFDTLQ